MGLKFHERFELPIDVEEAKRRFINRIQNRIFYYLLVERMGNSATIRRSVASELGFEFNTTWQIKIYTGGDFLRTLQGAEGFYKALSTELKLEMDAEITKTIDESETDLGIRWDKGRFIRTGARLLDEELVNEPLRWLAGREYQSVLQPFSKGLEHFLQSSKRPELLSDVITDMYEALEALSKIVTGRNTKDLSANAQSFLSDVKAPEPYKRILKEYISYANNFRHAVDESTRKPELSAAEVESFIYLTGIFIRLAIQKFDLAE
jgi:hypothetical protein